eukprot:m.51685 g.51685  ORF g.51685 m.51685 type:complete len:74 (-) comp10959_c0_seq2:265-486(-)
MLLFMDEFLFFFESLMARCIPLLKATACLFTGSSTASFSFFEKEYYHHHHIIYRRGKTQTDHIHKHAVSTFTN